MRIAINANCEFIGTRKTAESILANLQSYEAEQRFQAECWAVLASAIADWEASHAPEAWDFLSDYFKDVHGFRPSMDMFR